MLFKCFQLPGAVTYFLDWAVPDKRLWVCAESGLKSVNVADEDDPHDYSLNYHEMTCCGIDLHHETGLVASGDFSGNVYIWKQGVHDPVDKAFVGFPVRSLCWSPDSTSLQVGCLDGNVYNWIPGIKK